MGKRGPMPRTDSLNATLRSRCSNDAFRQIELAARIQCLTVSEFIRVCVTNGAKSVVRRYNSKRSTD